jgi:hypothetical protein
MLTEQERLRCANDQLSDLIIVRNKTIELQRIALREFWIALDQTNADLKETQGKLFQQYNQNESLTAKYNLATWLAIIGWVAFVIAFAAGDR